MFDLETLSFLVESTMSFGLDDKSILILPKRGIFLENNNSGSKSTSIFEFVGFTADLLLLFLFFVVYYNILRTTLEWEMVISNTNKESIFFLNQKKNPYKCLISQPIEG